MNNYEISPPKAFGWKTPQRRNVKGKTWSRQPKRVVVDVFRPDPVPMASREHAPFLVGLSGYDPERARSR